MFSSNINYIEYNKLVIQLTCVEYIRECKQTSSCNRTVSKWTNCGIDFFLAQRIFLITNNPCHVFLTCYLKKKRGGRLVQLAHKAFAYYVADN